MFSLNRGKKTPVVNILVWEAACLEGCDHTCRVKTCYTEQCRHVSDIHSALQFESLRQKQQTIEDSGKMSVYELFITMFCGNKRSSPTTTDAHFHTGLKNCFSYMFIRKQAVLCCSCDIIKRKETRLVARKQNKTS